MTGGGYVARSTPESVAIGQRFHDERLRLGLSPRAMCAIAEVPLAKLANWETGHGAPDAIGLAALAEFGGDVLFIVTGQSAAIDITPADRSAKPLALPAPSASSSDDGARQALAALDPAARQRLLIDMLSAELHA